MLRFFAAGTPSAAIIINSTEVNELERVGKCIIITGLSGAGKTTALNILEDQGFFAIDNLPSILLPQLMDVLSRNKSAVQYGVAIVIDIRGEELLGDLLSSMETIKKMVTDVKLLFLEASDDWLVRRYETTRRRHPLGRGVTILESVARERMKLEEIKGDADIVLDTSSLLLNDLRCRILSELHMDNAPPAVIISSFGFKYGAPKDCDYMFDARFLPNPNYVPELKNFSGKDAPVVEYLEKIPEKKIFLEKLENLLDFVLIQYNSTGKKQLHAAIGCTGGRHRSVAITEQIASHLEEKGHKVVVNHRDIDRKTE